MEVRVVAPDAVGAVGAALVRDGLAAAGRSEPTLMAALGTSALGVYRALAAFDLPPLRLVQLDEYLGVAVDDPRSLYGWLFRVVATPLGVPEERVVQLRGDVPDLERACRRYDDAVAAAGGVDVAVLGLGPNGHLGFNEPPSGADAPTRPVRLSDESLAANARYWPGLAVPTDAVTAGMSTILAARRLILVVTGSTKRTILRRLLEEPIRPDLPASYLRDRSDAVLIADSEAWPADLDASRP
jgi:glucosamine-6-phosphate deaminase